MTWKWLSHQGSALATPTVGASGALLDLAVAPPRAEKSLAEKDRAKPVQDKLPQATLAGANSAGQAFKSRNIPRRGGPMSLPHYASRGPARFLLHYVFRHWVSHSVVLIAVLSAVGCAIGSQYAVKNLVDVLGLGNPSDWQLWGAVALLLGLVAGDNLLWRLAGWVAAKAFVAVGGDLRLDLFEHLSGHGTRYFTDRFPGALAGRISNAANSAWSIQQSMTWTTIPPAAAVLASIAVLSIINWQMTLVLLVIVSAIGAVVARLAAGGAHLHENFAGRAAAVSGHLTDVVSNIGLVRAFGAADREHARLSRKIAHEKLVQIKSLLSLERVRLFHAASVFVVTAGVLVWAVTLWRAGSITTGDVVLTTTLGITLLGASRDLAMAMVDLFQHFAKLGEAVKELGLPHEMVDAPDAKPLIHLGGRVTFENVSFDYPNGEGVLKDFNLDIKPGQKVGLVGRSGAGKSTILALLQRLYDPTEGRVLIDGQDVSRVTQQSLRRSIAVVHQDISMFHRSILENIRYGRSDATDEEVYQATEAAHCTEFIKRLPEGFQTVVGERGLKTSGGQRQRIAIARAFLSNAPIILLDEATSALDTESEQAIQEALMRLVQGRTVIAVAHRLSTLDSFDRIIVLESGSIVEDGSSKELLRKKGMYSRMYGRQLAAAAQS
jgi:ATP-binding cassette, subfamily B, bacterial